jgi:integrase/recombinase XerD
MKIKTAVKEWLVECEIRKYTPKTLRGYRINLNIFLRYCEEELEIDDMEDVSMLTIKKFTQAMIKKGHKGTYVNGLLKCAKSFIQYVYEEYDEGFNTRNKKFTWVKEERPVVRAFKPKDVRYILNNCKGIDYLSIRDTAIITMLIETGVRCWELCCIQPKDIHEDYIIIQGKNHKQRAIPITPVLKKALMKYDRTKENYFAFKNMENYYFLSNTGRQLTNSGMEHMIRRRSKGIDSEVRCSPHTFRHTFAQMQLKMGTDLYSLSRLLGHESVSITQIYLRSLEDAEIVKMNKNSSVLLNM